MIRGIAIFAFFTLSTVLVIVLQPGPREDFSSSPSDLELFETSRNQLQVLDELVADAMLKIPDNVASELKAARDTQAREAVEPVPNLQARLDTSAAVREALTGSDVVAPETMAAPANTAPAATPFAAILAAREAQSATPAPVRAATPGTMPRDATPYIAPELRDMSWQTLNALNSLGQVSKAPGQEGSLLNSIVRRSMGHVDGTQPLQAAPTTFTAPRTTAVPAAQVPVQRTARLAAPERGTTGLSGSASNTYTVSSGDTLALIAIKLYGSALATDRLLSDNPSLRRNPNALRIGQVLKYSMP